MSANAADDSITHRVMELNDINVLQRVDHEVLASFARTIDAVLLDWEYTQFDGEPF